MAEEPSAITLCEEVQELLRNAQECHDIGEILLGRTRWLESLLQDSQATAALHDRTQRQLEGLVTLLLEAKDALQKLAASRGLKFVAKRLLLKQQLRRVEGRFSVLLQQFQAALGVVHRNIIVTAGLDKGARNDDAPPADPLATSGSPEGPGREGVQAAILREAQQHHLDSMAKTWIIIDYLATERDEREKAYEERRSRSYRSQATAVEKFQEKIYHWNSRFERKTEAALESARRDFRRRWQSLSRLSSSQGFGRKSDVQRPRLSETSLGGRDSAPWRMTWSVSADELEDREDSSAEEPATRFARIAEGEEKEGDTQVVSSFEDVPSVSSTDHGTADDSVDGGGKIADHDLIPSLTKDAGADLWLAAYRGDAEWIDQLLMGGVDLETKCPNPADIWEQRAKEEAAAVVVQDHIGTTPLLIAALRGHRLCVRLLLDGGANVKAKTPDGRTAEDLARSYNHVTVAFLIKQKTRLREAAIASLASTPPTRRKTC
eukprot:scaffold7339_cov249-Pinguiococcus_pyrenoidosus.AAC.18